MWFAKLQNYLLGVVYGNGIENFYKGLTKDIYVYVNNRSNEWNSMTSFIAVKSYTIIDILHVLTLFSYVQ